MDLAYLIGEAHVQFQAISNGLGDYGMIRVADWLHPFLQALSQKVLCLKAHLENMYKAVDDCLVLKQAHGYPVEKPTPSGRMIQRAGIAIERAVKQDGNHAQSLLDKIEELRLKSSKDRLPEVRARIGDACVQLDAVFSSPKFRAIMGDSFPSGLPRITDEALGQGEDRAQIADLPSYVQISEVVDDEGDSRYDPSFNLRTACTPQSHCAIGNLETISASDLRSAATPQSEKGDYVEPPSLSCQQLGLQTDAVSAWEAKQLDAEVRSSSKRKEESQLEEESASLCYSVLRLAPVTCGVGFRRVDRRGLRLECGLLDVFHKGSAENVKMTLDVVRDVEDCNLLQNRRRLSLIVRQQGSADIDSGIWKTKSYFFEFDSPDEATAFHEAMIHLQSSGM